MVDKKVRVAKAREFFLKGYNCSQSVFCAFSDMYSIPEDLSLKLSASFGGGIGRTRSVCGTVSGMVMVANLLKGYSDPKDTDGKKETYQMVQQLLNKFKEQNGSIICAELLGLKPKEDSSATPSPRTDEYYKKRPCPLLCKDAVEILEEYLILNSI